MSRRRRAALLAGLAIVLGTLAASDVAGREAALKRQLGPAVPVVVARTRIPEGDRIERRHLGVRMVPQRYAPKLRYASPAALEGLTAARDIPAGSDLHEAMLQSETRQAPGAPVRPGERVVEVVGEGPPDLIVPGARVDVLATRQSADGGGATRIALQDAEVLAVRDAPEARGDGPPRVAVALRVTLAQAVRLATAQSVARDLRLLPRPAGEWADARGARAKRR